MAPRPWRSALFYAIPLAIAGFAATRAYRFYRADREPDPAEEPQLRIRPNCAPGRYVCKAGILLATTGDEAPAGASDPCEHRRVVACSRVCTASGIPLIGIDDATARVHLCDPPEDVASLIGDVKSYLNMPTEDAGTCVGDGFAPTADGAEQCLMRSRGEPSGKGVVVANVRCKHGVLAGQGTERHFITRKQAVALWCKRGEGGGDEARSSLSRDASMPSDDGGLEAPLALDGGADAVADGDGIRIKDASAPK